MFGSPEANKRAIAEAKSRGEFDKITYAQAMKRKPKEGSCFISTVEWDGAPIEYETIEFKTIGVQSVVKPPKPLPRGYELHFHDQWIDLFKQIFDAKKDYTFEQLDDCVRDWYGLEKFIGRNYGDCPIWWYAKGEYCRWAGSIDDAWAELPKRMRDLFNQAIPHFEPYSPTEDGIGNREMPPSLEECLETMLQYLRDGKFIENREEI